MPEIKKKKSKNWLLLKIREWHLWMGIALSGFILLVCATGIYMNHKDLFKGEKEHHSPGAMALLEGVAMAAGDENPPHPPLLTPQTPLNSFPVSFEQAMARAAETFGEDAVLEKVELKNEHGTMVYKIKTDKYAGPEMEMMIDAHNSTKVMLKNKDSYAMQYTDAQGHKTAGYDWGKIIEHLHTGEFFGNIGGKLLIDVTSVVIIVLTLSGVYLWWIPVSRKRKSKKEALLKKALLAT